MMSKTKEEILRGINSNLDNTTEFYQQALVTSDAMKAMDAWADQKLEEYKERLKEKLKDEIVIGQTLVFKKIDEL